MLTLFRKKKLAEEKVANVFVNTLLDLVDEGFPEVAALINEDPEFSISPNINAEDSDRFLLIMLAGNMKYIPDYFTNYQDFRLMDLINRKMALALGVEADALKQTISNYQSFFTRINHPSKNTHYAMSKAVFYKYELNDFQSEYFRNMKTPNPIFLKRLDDIVAHFIWDWESFQNKFRVVE
ncbi:MAG: hypothetical protein ACFB10_15100 [Salibacteraceae bacterium]